MKIEIDISAIRRIKWNDYVLRFFFGGLVTAVAGVIAKEFGPGVGGLFLAFPAILPASATLIEKSEREKKLRHGLHGERRGRQAAAIDAAGAALGSMGLVAFGLIAWQMLPNTNAWIVLSSATAGWMAVSGLAWWIRKSY